MPETHLMQDWSISTHAPAGGATLLRLRNRQARHISTHAPAGGATTPAGLFLHIQEVFLLTPLREGRPRI